jgi:hypothetical protein
MQAMILTSPLFVLTRYTEPEREIKRLLERLGLELPAQPPPRITAGQADPATSL